MRRWNRETREQGLGPPPNGTPLGGGAETTAMALESHRVCRWTVTLLGALMTITVVLAHAAHTAT
ncbi:MAG TPA: hypothetical protein VK920_06835 [Solirubrobacterales bacterium]|nr:hypothetical protein [Solirubrobacterales bacterium]